MRNFDYKQMVEMLSSNAKSTKQKGLELLYSALKEEICPPFWFKKKDILSKSDIGDTEDDFVHSFFTYFQEIGGAIHLRLKDNPKAYLEVSVKNFVNSKDPSFYFWERLKNLHYDSSIITMISKDIFSLVEYSSEPLFHGEIGEAARAVAHVTIDNRSRIMEQDLINLVTALLKAVRAPMRLSDIWWYVKRELHIQIFEVDLDEILYSFTKGEADNNKEHDGELVEELGGGEESIYAHELEELSGKFYDELNDDDRKTIRCLSNELRRATTEERNVDWTAIAECIGLKGHTGARHRIYVGEDSILKRFKDFINAGGYDTMGFKEALRIMLGYCQQ